MSKIVLANEYTPIKTAAFAWQVKPKPQPLAVKEQIKKNKKSTWAKEGLGIGALYSGDLLSAMYEDTEKQLAAQRFPNQEDFKQAEKRLGKRMLHTQFIKRVLALNPNLLYEDSRGVKGCGAFYLVVNTPEGNSKQYTGACFRKGWIPEWTIIDTDAADLPTQDGLTYGWRTVVQRLIQKKAITYRQAVTTFGPVHRQDLCARNWKLNTQAFRN